MGRPPSNGAPAFRFNPNEVAQMEAVLREHQGQIPAKELIVALAEKFSNSPERAGKITVQMKQVCNWFQNKRFALRSKLVKSPGKFNISPVPREEVAPVRNAPPLPQHIPVSSGQNMVKSTSETPQMEFEAKSARDGAWYDVQAFLSHRYLETGNPEVLVRFAGFGQEEDEWINVRKHVRQRSLPCEASECIAVLPGDLILCFQEGKEQALYFDAHVLDAQRRRHDIRGCRCRFLVRYGHDQSEEIVPLRKICRRPENDYRLQQLNASNETASVDPQKCVVAPSSSSTFRVTTPTPSSASITVPAHISSAAPAPILSPAPTQTPAPVPVSVSAPVAVPVSVSNSAPLPISASIPAPVSVSASTPAPVPVSASTPAPVPVSASIPAPVPVSASIPAPGPVYASILAPGPVSASPVPFSASIPAPVPVSASVPAPFQVSASIPAPVPDSVSVQVPVPVPVSAPGQVKVNVPTPDLIPVSVQVPESNKVESNSVGVLAGGASAEANTVCPGVGNMPREPDKAESTNPETVKVTGSINPVITASGPEKIDAINPGNPGYLN